MSVKINLVIVLSIFALLTSCGHGLPSSVTLPTPSATPSATPSTTPATFQVTASGAHLTISPASVQTVNSGATQSFTVTSAFGFLRLDTVGGTCAAGGWANNMYNTGVITADCTVIFNALILGSQILPASQGWTGVTYGNSVYAAVAWGSATAAYSADGATWTATTIPTGNWQAITYGGGTFVAIANGTTDAVTSPNGITWTARTLPYPRAWQSVAYGNGTFVAVAKSGDISRSTNGGVT